MPAVDANKIRPQQGRTETATAWLSMHKFSTGLWWILLAASFFIIAARIYRRWRRISDRGSSAFPLVMEDKCCTGLDLSPQIFPPPSSATSLLDSHELEASFPAPTIRRHSHPTPEQEKPSFAAGHHSYTRLIPSTSNRYPGIIQHGDIFQSKDQRRHVKTFHIA